MALGSAYPAMGSGSSRLLTSQVSPSSVQTLPVTPYAPPGYDYGRLESLTQQFAAPAIGRLRRGVREATMAGQYEENPAVRAMMARRSLEGYGAGIGDILSGSRSSAANIYGLEYGNQNQAAYQTWLERMARERGQISTASQVSESQFNRRGGSSSSGPTNTFYNTPQPTMTGGFGGGSPVSPGGGQWGGGQAGYWGTADPNAGGWQKSDAYTQASPERQAQLDYADWASRNGF